MWTLENVLEMAHQVIDPEPTRTNGGECVLYMGTEPWCVVGQILAKLDRPLFDAFVEKDIDDGECFKSTSWFSLSDDSEFFRGKFTENANMFLANLQAVADEPVVPTDDEPFGVTAFDNETWGAALREAEDSVSDF